MICVRCVARSVPPGMKYSCLDTVEEHVSAIKIISSAIANGFKVILRSVASLLHHLQALKPNLPDFDKQFLQGLRIYRAAQTKSQFLENSVSLSSWFKLEYLKEFQLILCYRFSGICKDFEIHGVSSELPADESEGPKIPELPPKLGSLVASTP
jgi:hypothetical protein